MNDKIAAIGEAMVEFAPVGDGLYRRGFAGDAFNTIWHMAQLLGESATCGFTTRVGNDALSEDFLKQLENDGLDTSAITRDPVRTMGLYLIELDGAERSFHYWRGESAARYLGDDYGVISASVIGTDLIYLTGITLAVLTPEGRSVLFEVLINARQAGAKIAYDPNYRERLWPSQNLAHDVTLQMLAVTDIALPSFDDEINLWGDSSPTATIERHLQCGVGEVVVKNGGYGVTLSADGHLAQFATTSPVTIRDTSGAGDAFNAGYLASKVSGLSHAGAVNIGHKLASLVLSYPGARAPIEVVRQFSNTLFR